MMSVQKPHRAALFDMDRTLLRVETASLYVRYEMERGFARRRDLLRTLWWVARYTMGVLDATKIAEKVLLPLKGTHEDVLATRCEDWFRICVERHICDRGRETVERHRLAGDICAIVTGASPYASRPLARLLGIDYVVASNFELDSSRRFTGKPEIPLCVGKGKIERTERLAQELNFDLRQSTFYSDSVSDLPLLEYVHEPVAVNPDPRLKRIARKRGWRIEYW